MMRKTIASVVAGALMFLGPVAVANAYTPTDTPETTQVTATTSISVLPTESEETTSTSEETEETENIGVAGESSTIGGDSALSYTGVNFNVPLTIAIAALVVLIGAGLVFLGGRSVRANRAH